MPASGRTFGTAPIPKPKRETRKDVDSPRVEATHVPVAHTAAVDDVVSNELVAALCRDVLVDPVRLHPGPKEVGYGALIEMQRHEPVFSWNLPVGNRSRGNSRDTAICSRKKAVFLYKKRMRWAHRLNSSVKGSSLSSTNG